MYNNNSSSSKSQVLDLLRVYKVSLSISNYKLATELIFFKYLELAKKGVVFVPLLFETNQEKKISKKPLVAWKNLDIEESINFLKRLKEHYRGDNIKFGIAIRLDDFNEIVVIDIDDIEKFNQFYQIDKFLEDIKEDAFCIVKSLSRGYHVYLPRSHFVLDKVNNKKLLEKYGFEVKTQDLLVIPPSAFVNKEANKEFRTQILYVSEDLGLRSEKETGPALRSVLNAIEKLQEGKEVTQTELAETKEEDVVEDVVEEVKKRVRFRELLKDNFVKDMGKYELYRCPFHPPDQNPSFCVYRNNGFELAIDFHDNEAYDIIEFYKKYKSVNFKQAVFELAQLANLEVKKTVSKENLIGGKFFIDDKYVYKLKGRDGKEVICIGPSVRVVAKILDSDAITYECEYQHSRFILKDIQDFETIRKRTGKAIVDEKSYKEYMNFITDECKKVKKVFRAIEFGSEYIHPCVNEGTEGIWSEFAFYKEFEKAKEFYKPEEHLSLIKKSLEDGRALGFIYCFALASLIAEQLNCSPVALFVEGPSRVGKTTLGLLATNLFYPSTINFSADFTKVGLELTLKTLKNCVVLIDELAVSNVDTEQIVFAISSGKGRVRGTKQLTVKYSNLSSYVIFTSEVTDTSFFKRSGAFRRFLRLTIFTSQDICSFCDVAELRRTEVWGAGVELAKFIQSSGYLKDKNFKERIYDILVKRNYLPFFNVAFPLFFALEIYEQFFNSKFEKMREYIFNLLEIHVKLFERKVDVVSEFKEKFSEFLISNVNKFVVRDKVLDEDGYVRVKETEPRGYEVYGKIDLEKKIAYVLPKNFKNFMFESGFSLEILQLLAEQGLIEKKEKDRYTVKTTIKNFKVSAYAVVLSKFSEIDLSQIIAHKQELEKEELEKEELERQELEKEEERQEEKQEEEAKLYIEQKINEFW